MASPAYKNFTQAALSDTGTATSPSDTAIGDLVICFVWSQFTTTATTHTIQSGFTEIRTHSHNDGTTCGRLSVAAKVATAAGAQSYVPYTIANATAGQTCAGIITVTGAYPYYPQSFPSNSSTLTTNAVPDPPSLTGLYDDMLILAIAAWQVTTAGSTSATVMANYTLRINGPTGSHVTHLAVATRERTGLSNTTEDPAAFGDNVTPNGSASMTIAIPQNLPATVASDDFNRADNTTLGANWTLVDRTMGISSGSAIPTVLNWCSAYYNAYAFTDDHYSEVIVGANIAGGGGLGPMVRMKADFSYYYLYADGSFVFLQKITAGSASTTLATITFSIGLGSQLGLDVQGSTLKSFCNGVCKDIRTDTSNTTGIPGIFCFGAGATTNTMISGWNAGNYVAPLGQPTMRRWGGIPQLPGGQLVGRSW
jgi:hypothetical protein